MTWKVLVLSFDIFVGKSDPAPEEQDIGASRNIVLNLAQLQSRHWEEEGKRDIWRATGCCRHCWNKSCQVVWQEDCCPSMDMIIVNAWLLYRRDCDSTCSISEHLLHGPSAYKAEISKKKMGQPSSDVEKELEKKKRCGPAKAIPSLKVRTDAVSHWPAFDSGWQCCEFPNCKGYSGIACEKCDANFCLNKNILAFHTCLQGSRLIFSTRS